MKRVAVTLKYEVDRCVRCLDVPAVIFAGHVLHGSHRVLAGWCRPCHERMEQAFDVRLRAVVAAMPLDKFLNCDMAGWIGHWVPAMGLRLRDSPSLTAPRARKRGLL